MDLCRIFTSATRAPFLMTYESANLDEVPLGKLWTVAPSERRRPGIFRVCSGGDQLGDLGRQDVG